MTKMEAEQNQTDSVLPAVRRAEILRLVKQLGQITVTEMSARFEVSLDTIRRDLDTLADQGLISRIHGGAVPIDSMASADSPFEAANKRASSRKNKHRSRRRAADLVRRDAYRQRRLDRAWHSRQASGICSVSRS